jgi:protoheme IX farnesyltransferase
MTTLPQPIAAPAATRPRVLALVTDYVELAKARVTSLVMMSAWCGFYLAAVKAHAPTVSWQLFHAVLGIGLVAGGTAAFNQVMERDLDGLMRRTWRRPLPARRMSVLHAEIFAAVLLVGGLVYLLLACNALTALLTAATSAAYLGAYTPLKRRSKICTFIGAFPGAMPPVLGWAAATNSVGWETLALFGIVFAWQFPHFHSIAWLYREDYESAQIRMLPVVETDGRSTAREIVAYSLLLIPISMAPVWLRMASAWYLVAAASLGAAFFWTGYRLATAPAAPASAQSKARARQVLQASVFYLPLLFAVLMLSAVS